MHRSNNGGYGSLTGYGAARLTTAAPSVFEENESCGDACARQLPSLEWIKAYDFAWLWNDVAGGVTLGLVLLECSTGRYPYPEDATCIGMAQTIIESPVPQPPAAHFSSEFCDLIAQTLQKLCSTTHLGSAPDPMNRPPRLQCCQGGVTSPDQIICWRRRSRGLGLQRWSRTIEALLTS